MIVLIVIIVIVLGIILDIYYMFKDDDKPNIQKNKKVGINVSEEKQSPSAPKATQENLITPSEHSTQKPEKAESIKNSNSIKRYFNGYNDLEKFCMNEEIFIEPYTASTLDNDLFIFGLLNHDKETRLYMHEFTGMDAKDRIMAYLMNTIQCTNMGIAFGYSIRLNKGLMGFVKVTSPSHNKVTNNFDGWLIDYIMIPMFRGKKILKNSVPPILKVVKNIGADKIYAMVDPANKASMHLLNFWGFVDTNKLCSKNDITGNQAHLFVKYL